MASDAALATALLAQVEKHRARESCELTGLICSPDYQHFLATVGNDVFTHFSEQLSIDEYDKQALLDRLVIANSPGLPESAETYLKCLEEVRSQSAIWRSATFRKIHDAIEQETRRYRRQNRSLLQELAALRKA